MLLTWFNTTGVYSITLWFQLSPIKCKIDNKAEYTLSCGYVVWLPRCFSDNLTGRIHFGDVCFCQPQFTLQLYIYLGSIFSFLWNTKNTLEKKKKVCCNNKCLEMSWGLVKNTLFFWPQTRWTCPNFLLKIQPEMDPRCPWKYPAVSHL